ncbi:MFS transporter [Burkholderia contaminans]|uniref:MFS transporter n=1 Tax=Burkholderia contaminans TaxID=488447 RepID=UPI001F12940C|nr:MFS transporter [Burkholderia contaminans]UMY33488.1 MFS transporter [Burkholderia contaminans]
MYVQGIRANLQQFIWQAVQVFFVGLVIGMERSVLPVVAAQDFGVPKSSFLYLLSFVISFGLVKGALNFVAGRLSERIGRKRVLILGWIAAIPVALLIFYARSWWWIVVANLFLGINQGFAWSMTVTSKVDITRAEQRGLATGINEFAGYAAVGLAGVATAYLTGLYGPRSALLGFAIVVITVALLTALLFVRETLPWAHAERHRHASGTHAGPPPRFAEGLPEHPSARQVFVYVSFRNRTFSALCQAGVANKVADTLLWVLFPLYLHEQGLSLVQTGWVTGVYGMVWGASQLVTGPLSDRIGRRTPVVAGLWLLAAGIATAVIIHGFGGWIASATIMGVGMALLYPNLIASVADIAYPTWRSSALGTYRYWRDSGYAIGAFVLGLIAQSRGDVVPAFWFTAVWLVASGAWVLLRAQETHPGRS